MEMNVLSKSKTIFILKNTKYVKDDLAINLNTVIHILVCKEIHLC